MKNKWIWDGIQNPRKWKINRFGMEFGRCPNMENTWIWDGIRAEKSILKWIIPF